MEVHDYIVDYCKIGQIKYTLIELDKLELINKEMLIKDYRLPKEYFYD